jgi:cobalt-zinc-cadmium efflux system membrane fusion protein
MNESKTGRRLRMRGIFVAAAGLVTLSACGNDGRPVPEKAPVAEDVVTLTEAQMRAARLRTEVVASGPIQGTVEVPGSVHPPDTAHATVGSIVEGRVVAVHVLPGDVVRAGQMLVEIHAHELSEAQRDVTAARAEVQYRSSAFARSEELLDAGAVSLEEVERRSADLETARAELTRAEEMIEHLAPSGTGNASAVATRDGTVFSVDAKVGQAVLPGTPLVELGRTDVLWVTAFVPEQTAGTLVPCDTVEVRFGEAGGAVPAHLVRAGTFVDPSTRSVEMRFELDSIPRGVRPGSFAVVSVSTDAAYEGLELPDEAAVRVGDRDVVFVVEGAGSFRAVPVTVTTMRAGRVGVRGVPTDAELVVEGAYFLKAALELVAENEEGGEAP